MASEQQEPTIYEAFMARGDCCDEIAFVFNDDQMLYVSQNLLMLASLVFKAMFDSKSNFKENTERTVKIVDIEFKDFREFLYCIHPDIQKPVTDDNVLNIASVAEKYQSQLIISRCKDIMVRHMETLSSYPSSYGPVHKGLLILHKASELHYEEISKQLISTIAKSNAKYFTGMSFSNDEEDAAVKNKQCNLAFMQLCANVRMKLLMKRLNEFGDMQIKRYH